MFGHSIYDIHTKNGFKYLNVPSGGEGPDLVFLHGMFGGLSNYDPLIKRLQGVNIYVPDIPLYAMEKSELCIPALTNWIKSYLAELKIEKPVLLGNSLGGHLALNYAHLWPGELKGLVLTGSSGLMENDLGTTVPRRNDRQYIKKQANLTFYEDLADEVLVDEIMAITQSPRKLLKLLNIARSTHRHNMEEALPEIDVPTLLVWGRDDIITPPEVAKTFKEKLPDARLEWIDKCGHAPMMERPGEFAGYLSGFINELLSDNIKKTSFVNYENNYTHI